MPMATNNENTKGLLLSVYLSFTTNIIMRAIKPFLNRLSYIPHHHYSLLHKKGDPQQLVEGLEQTPFSVTGQYPIYKMMMKTNPELFPLYIQMLLKKFPYFGVNPRSNYNLLLKMIRVQQQNIKRTSQLIAQLKKSASKDEQETAEQPKKETISDSFTQFRQKPQNMILVIAALILLFAIVKDRPRKQSTEPDQKEATGTEDRIDQEMLVKKLLEDLVEIRINELMKDENEFKVRFVYDDGTKEQFKYRGDINKLLSMVEHFEKGKFERTPIIWEQPEFSIGNILSDGLGIFTPFLGLAITFWIFRRMTPDSLIGKMTNKRNFKIEGVRDIKVRFADVAGMEQAKKQVTEFVDFLKQGDKYRQMGAKIPKGALLTGPPGTGKTMLAKACAGEADVSFFYISGSEFVEMFVGLGASKVRDLFERARMEAPSIIFIDEIDAIGKKRETSRNQEKDSTLNQLLVEMDGFSSRETVIVLAATNRKDTLDNALTRPGRFDRMVEVTLPDIKAREQIFKVHLKPLKVDPTRELSVVSKRLAELTPGFSGADIANLCNQAAIIATRRGKNYIQDKDFEDASERITAGYEKKDLATPKTKKRVAYHQAGHAVCGWFLKGGDPLIKLTIIPRSKGALGYAQYLPKSSYIRTRSQLIDQIAILLGGMTSEEINFGNTSSGASDDLQKVYQVARKMVAEYGMGRNTYNVTLEQQSMVRKESQALEKQMDQEMLVLVQEARARCKKVLNDQKDRVAALAEALLEKETVNSEQIQQLLGKRPFELAQ